MIWCIEDDPGIREIEVYTLNSMGFEACGMGNAEELFSELKSSKPELIILDIMLPGTDGVEILRKLKAKPDTAAIPVIMATARGSEYDKVQSLDIGADDYLVKPFGMMEMVSRVKAVLRRCAPSAPASTLKAGSVEMNLAEHTVTVDGQRAELTFKEFELLRLFMSNPGMVFTRDRLFSDVWGMDHLAESRTVDMHIRTLRQKLGLGGEMIKTVRNVGYKLEAAE